LCRVGIVTTDDGQLELVPLADQVRSLESAVELMLRRITVWTKLPDERTDWDLETLLDELATASLALRRLRGDADLPF
jgi:hypothetical protein